MVKAVNQSVSDSVSYIVQSILDKKTMKGKPYYLVKWVGYEHSENTWEPLEHLQNIIQHVRAFDQTHRKGKKIKKAHVVQYKNKDAKKIINEERIRRKQGSQRGRRGGNKKSPPLTQSKRQSRTGRVVKTPKKGQSEDPLKTSEKEGLQVRGCENEGQDQIEGVEVIRISSENNDLSAKSSQEIVNSNEVGAQDPQRTLDQLVLNSLRTSANGRVVMVKRVLFEVSLRDEQGILHDNQIIPLEGFKDEDALPYFQFIKSFFTSSNK